MAHMSLLVILIWWADISIDEIEIHLSREFVSSDISYSPFCRNFELQLSTTAGSDNGVVMIDHRSTVGWTLEANDNPSGGVQFAESSRYVREVRTAKAIR